MIKATINERTLIVNSDDIPFSSPNVLLVSINQLEKVVAQQAKTKFASKVFPRAAGGVAALCPTKGAACSCGTLPEREVL